MRFLRRLIKEEDGPTSVEYAMMLALIMGMIVTAITAAGGSLEAFWSDSATQIGNITPVTSVIAI